MTTTSTLADLATTFPAASRVFQRFGLDYCCGGGRSLAAVCAAKGLDPATILAAIEAEPALGALPRWNDAPLPDLIQFIVDRYHTTVRAELPALISMASRVERRHEAKEGCPHGLADLLTVMHERILEHLEKEERVLFPMILDGHGTRVGGPVRVMEEEHDDHGRSLGRIRQLTNNFIPPDGACTTWRALYMRLAQFEAELMDHVHLENHVLFPRALEAQES